MADETAAGWADLLRAGRAPAAAILVGGILLHSMNVLLTATVLPSLVADVGGADQISWPTTAYLAASLVAASCAGMTVARTGAKLAFTLGAFVFAVGTLGCALAPSMLAFVGGRFVQGFGGGLVMATAYVLVRNVFPKTLWPRVFAMFASVWSVSVLLGPLVGGAFASFGDWRGAFYTLSGVALAIAVLAVVAFPPAAPPEEDPPSPPWSCVGLIVLAIAALSAAAIAPAAGGKAACLALGFAIAAFMLARDRKAARPMLPSDAFRLASATGVGLWTALLLLVAFAPLQVFGPMFLQALHGLDPLGAGYAVASASLAWTVAALGVAGFAVAWQGRMLQVGPLLMAAGFAATAAFLPAGPLALTVLAMSLAGGGIGSTWAFVAQRIMGNARPGEEDLAAASVATVQQGGTAVGAALAGVVANLAGFARGGDVADAPAAPVAVMAVSVLMALVAAAMGGRLRRLTA